MLIILLIAIILITCHYVLYKIDIQSDIVAVFILGWLVSAIGLFVAIACIISGHAGVTYRINSAQIEYDSLIQRYEIISSEYEDVSKADVIRDIAEWNKDVYETKYWASNLWTNWFYDQDYANSLNYIEFNTEE